MSDCTCHSSYLTLWQVHEPTCPITKELRELTDPKSIDAQFDDIATSRPYDSEMGIFTDYEFMDDEPDYVKMTLEEFIAGVATSAFTVQDGIGYYATKDSESNKNVWTLRPDFAKMRGYTHVHWYNK